MTLLNSSKASFISCILVLSRAFAVLLRYLESGTGLGFGLGSFFTGGDNFFNSTSIRFLMDLVLKLYLSRAGIFTSIEVDGIEEVSSCCS